MEKTIQNILLRLFAPIFLRLFAPIVAALFAMTAATTPANAQGAALTVTLTYGSDTAVMDLSLGSCDFIDVAFTVFGNPNTDTENGWHRTFRRIESGDTETISGAIGGVAACLFPRFGTDGFSIGDTYRFVDIVNTPPDFDLTVRAISAVGGVNFACELGYAPNPDGNACEVDTSPPDTDEECRHADLTTPIYDSSTTACRAAESHQECSDATSGVEPILGDDGSCNAAANSQQCRDAYNTAPIASNTGTCRAAGDSQECRNNHETFPIHVAGGAESGSCIAATSNTECEQIVDSQGTQIVPFFQLDGSCGATAAVLPTDAAECFAAFGFDMPVFASGEHDNCRAAADQAECTNAGGYWDSGACRAATNVMECTTVDAMEPVFDSSESDFCRAVTDDADCFAVDSGEPVFDSAETDNCRAAVANDCDADEVLVPATADYCQGTQTVLATVTNDSYTTESCRSAGWTFNISVDSAQTNAAEICEIPVVRDDTPDSVAALSQRGGIAPQLATEGATADECIIRKSGGFDNAVDCDDANLFGSGGFPRMPSGFDSATDRLTVDVVAGSENRIIFDNAVLARVLPSTPPDEEEDPTPPATGFSGSEKDEEDYAAFAGIAGSALGVVLAMHLWGGDPAAFSFTPNVGYAITDSGYSYHYGARADFREGDWHLYWSAGQRNANGDFGGVRYASGIAYDGDFWAASFAETMQGGETDMRFSVSGIVDGGAWEFRPTYRFHTLLEKEESESDNELNVEAAMRFNRWTIRPTAGFTWRRMDEFGDSAKFRISAVRRF